MEVQVDWDKINEDKRDRIILGQAINLASTKFDMFNKEFGDKVIEIYHIIKDIEGRVFGGSIDLEPGYDEPIESKKELEEI